MAGPKQSNEKKRDDDRWQEDGDKGRTGEKLRLRNQNGLVQTDWVRLYWK